MSSLCLLVGFVYYRTSYSNRKRENSAVLPSSKIGKAMETTDVNWEAKHPTPTPSPVTPTKNETPNLDEYFPVMGGSKSTQVVITGQYPAYDGISGLIEKP